jgi:serine/threonine protein kinase
MIIPERRYMRVIEKAISVLMVIFTLNLYVMRDAWAVMGADPGFGKPADNGAAGDICPLEVRTFDLPYHLGQVRDSHAGSSEFFVIHIQDAHCNRFAQKKVAEIIAYLKSEYGVKTINLEGGEGEYDLDIFRSVPEGPLRKKVAEHFLEIGELNGAEYYAVTDPGEARLWGVENRELYMRNLRVYRDSFEYRDRAAGYLEYLRNALNGVKADIYGPRLLKLDMAYNAYKSGNMEFREYITFLIERADESGLHLERYENLRELALSMRLESEVDFDAASAERDRLMNGLKDILSRNESRELVSKAAGYRTKRIPRHEFYGYLMEKAAQAGLREKTYPALATYIDYIKAFGSVRRDRISSELRALESDLRKPLFTNVAQRRLDRLSRDLVLLRNFFNISITRADYRYFLENKSDMDVSRYTDFIEEHPGAVVASADIPADIELLDGYRDRIARFFEYSFSRDKAFLDNMRFAGMPDGRRAAVLVTGGFHTENLCEMFREEGISYVSMIPRFTMEPGYECPYFDLLAGRVSGSRRMLSSILGGNAALQVASLFTPLGEGFWGAGYVRAAKISVVIDGMVTGGKRVSITDGSGRVLEVNGRKLVFGEGEDVHIRLSELMKRAGVERGATAAGERAVDPGKPDASGIGRGTTEWLKRYTRGLPLWFRDLIVAPLVEEGVYRGVALGFVSAAALLLTGGMDWRLVAVSMAVLQWTAGGLFISDHSPGEDASAYFPKSFLIPSLIAVINAVILPFLVSGPGQFMLTAVLVHAMANSIGIMVDELTGTAGREKAGGKEDEDIPGVESAPLTEVDMEALRDSSVPAGIQLRQEKWRAVFPLRKAVHNHLMAREEDFRGAAMTIPRIILGTGEPGGSDLRIEEPLGRGGFGLVFKATGVKGPMKNREAAVKVLHPDASDASKLSFMREYMFMRALSGAEGVIDTYGAGRYEINGKIYYYIVSEYAADGDLHEEIGRRKRAFQRGRRDEVFTLDETMDIGRQLLEALRVIHERDIIHSDIKPSNVFIFRQDDGSLKVKIGDLGIAHYAPDGRIDLLGRAAGTLPYLPAEALRTQIYTGKVDLYALGCLLYQMRHFGKLPYGTRDADRSELNKILSEKGTGAWTARRQELLAEELGVIVDSADHPFELLVAELLLGGDYGGITDAGTALRMLKNDMRRGISSSDDYLRRNELAKNTTRMGIDTTGEPREKAGHAKRTPERAGTRPRRPAEPPYAGALRGAGIRIGGVDPVGLEAPDTGQIGGISAGSWFRAKSWVANAWLAESVISLGVGAAVFLSGFVTLAPLAAMFAFWMPHLFFDNKGAARSMPVIGLAGATYGAMFLAMASPWGLLAIPALILAHRAVNRRALEKSRAEEEAQRQGRIFDSSRAGFPDERIAEMIEFGSGNDYYLGVTLYNNGDQTRRERVRELLSEEGIRLLKLQELVEEHAEEYGDMFRRPYERRTGDEREQAIRDRVLDIGRKNDVMAYGIELAKGGVNTLLHIILGGRIRSGEGSDNWGRMDDATYPEISGGFHGPYWVTFAEPAGDEWMDQENHVHYIVRNEREKDYILSALALAAERGLITAGYGESAKARVVTYEEFIAGSGRKGFGERFSRTGDGSESGPETEDGRREDKPELVSGEKGGEAAGAGAGRTIFDLLMFEHVNGLEERVKASEARLRALEDLDSTPPVMLENEKQITEEARERVRSVKELIREVNSAMSADDPLSMVKALRSIPGMVAPDAGPYGESVLSGLERLAGTQEWIQVDRDTTLVLPEGSPLEDVFLGQEAAGSFMPFSYGGRDGGFIVVREKALRKPYAALRVIVHETVHRSLDRKSYRSEMDGGERLAFRALDEAYTETMNAGAMLRVLKREPELGKRIFEGMKLDGVAAVLTEADPETQFEILARKILGENNTYKMERGLLGAIQEEGGIDAVMEFLEKGEAGGLERRYGSIWEDIKAVAAIDPEDRAQSPGFNAGMIMLSDSIGDPEMSGIARTIAEVLAGGEFEQMMMEWEGEFRTAENLDPDPDEDIIIALLQVKAAVRLFEEYKGGGFDRDAVPVDLIAKVEELAPAEFGLAGDAGGKPVTAGLSPEQNLRLVRELLSRHRVGARVHAAKEVMGDLRRGVADWVITPMAPMSSAAKMSIDRGTGRFIGREYGSETFVRGYGYEKSLSDETLSENIRAGFEKVLEEVQRPEFTDKMPRVIMYVPVDKHALARKVLDEVLGETGLESLADRFNIVREEGVPENGMVDEVMHVILGKSLLNYERFRKGDYGEEARFGKDAEIRLERFLRTLVADPASVDLGEDAALIARILDGAMSLDMAPVDYEEIREWKTAQDEVLRAM